ncbi:ubiquinone biosynthesis regulatory protein kinase UbiB [Simiduia curdlanivorans]|uniref:Ubiquinone biosynthesis regulatory protein kinase UbiB n=1 Tax=Simiduia curdlanivorans TaxID=1492769 RepID=A0ABV8V3N7_9GAMM|nr:ubiquinone biosynthesis regulatory protein kinase UbiB [Simiduia curdlanivorans]MDN3637312.1 ubiquinone biosynthesis regulatory protein kinase UbiB [Simiduia curdlanivorans]
MRALFRLFQIIGVALRYRLDLLLPNNKPWWLALLFSPLALLPKPAATDGERLRLSLERLGPIFIKFGQLLSTRPDLVPAELVLELRKLQDKVPAFDQTQLVSIVEQALGQPIADCFGDFSAQPLASASIAQVHTAKLHTGEDVIVKVVRPNLLATIKRDIALLKVIAKLLEAISQDGRRLRPVEIVDDYQITITDELNLLREAANCTQLRRNFLGSKLLYVPDVYWDYCRENVLVQERIYGIGVSDLAELEKQNTNMKMLAERGVEIFFTQVFSHNFFHADMHPGNIFVSRKTPDTPSYIAVDTAIMGSLTTEDQYYLARNLVAMFRRDYRQVAQLHVDSGWVPATTSVAAFESAIRTVCEPIFEKPLAEISFGQVLLQLFRTARRFNMEVQPQLVLLQKTLLNIEGLGRQLYPQLDLWSTAHPFLEAWLKQRYHPKTLLQEIKRFGPEWLEKLPHMPQKIYDALGNSENLTKQLADIGTALAREQIRQQQARRATRRHRLALIALAGAALVSLPEARAAIEQLNTSALALGLLGLYLWLVS